MDEGDDAIVNYIDMLVKLYLDDLDPPAILHQLVDIWRNEHDQNYLLVTYHGIGPNV